MKNNFKQIYLNMFFEEAGNIRFNLLEFKKFLETSIKFKDGNILQEDENLLVDIPADLFNYCYDHQKQIIKFEKIKSLMKDSKHYFNIKNKLGKDLFFTIFNFNEETEIKTFIFETFNLMQKDQLFQTAFQYFKKYCSNLDGFFNFYNNIGFCIINEYSNNIQTTIYHELSHYIQQTCNIRIIKDFQFDQDKIENNPRFQKLKQLNISLNDLNYYFSSTEFIPHIDDLIIGLWNTYKMFFNKENILSFISKINNEIVFNNKFINSNIFQKYSIANNNDVSPLLMFIASYFFNHKYQKNNSLVKTRLIRMKNEEK